MGLNHYIHTCREREIIKHIYIYTFIHVYLRFKAGKGVCRDFCSYIMGLGFTIRFRIWRFSVEDLGLRVGDLGFLVEGLKLLFGISQFWVEGGFAAIVWGFSARRLRE